MGGMILRITEELLTGIKEIDLQHAKLVELLNTLPELIREGKREEAIKFFREQFIWYVEYHLSYEEDFMKSIGYPDYENHKKIHETFRREIQRLIPGIEHGETKPS